MRTLRYIVLALLVILVVLVVVGFFLPSKVHLERSIEISRDKQSIFNVVNSLSNFNKWSPWYDLDPSAKYKVSGSEFGVGSKLEWQGNNAVGTGSNEIVESVVDSHIITKMFFGKSDAPAYATISVEQTKANDNSIDKTKVTWAFDNDFGYNIFYRYFGLVIEDMIAPDYERGLEKLKNYVESLPLYDYSTITTVETRTEKAYAIKAKTSMKVEEITPIIASSYGKIIKFISSKNIAMAGTPKIVNLQFSDSIYEFLAVIPVADNSVTDETNEIATYDTYQGKALKFIHKGSYSNLGLSYKIIEAYIQQNKIERNGNSWEDYVTDPGTTAESDLITHIYQPIQ